jgi:hypothetical protein
MYEMMVIHLSAHDSSFIETEESNIMNMCMPHGFVYIGHVTL